MVPIPCLRPREMAPVLGCAILLGFTASIRADPKPLSKEEQAKVDKAVDRGVDFLKRTQTEEGNWPRYYMGATKRWQVGECALPAYALLEAGVPASDPVIQKAADYIRPKALDTDWTYELSLAVLFFDRLGDPKDKKLIKTLALRLIAGQHRTGGWAYYCPKLKEDDEETFVKLLGELDKAYEGEKRPTGKTIKASTVPRSLQALTVFHERRRITWQERDVRIPPKLDGKISETEWEQSTKNSLVIVPTDNSNTQFVMLALWVAQRYDLPLRPTFDLLVERFERTQRADGWWPYHVNIGPSRSMICVGLLGLAIGRGLKLPMSLKDRAEAEDLRVLKGLVALYQEVGTPTGQMEKAILNQDPYFLWSVERVGMLYNLPTLADKEWYRWMAEILVTNQRSEGDWNDAPYNTKDVSLHGYGSSLNTAFALLILKRSHPMKELTPKLPFTSKELNLEIARLVPHPGSQERPTTAPSRNTKPDR